MRRLFAFLVVAMLVALPLSALQTPTAGHAAPAFDKTTLTGTLVAVPSSTTLAQPANLLVQVGNQTVLVQVTSLTSFVNFDYAPIGLGDLRDGHAVEVTGDYNGFQMSAGMVRDLSLRSLIAVQLQGTLSVAPAAGATYLCLANTSISSANAPRALAPTTTACPSNTLPVFFTAATSFRNQSNGTAALGQFKAGDALSVAGTYDGVQITATQVTDTSLPATIAVQIKGRLAFAPAAGATVLCLFSASISSANAPRVQTGITPCPANDLPVYLTTSTVFRTRDGIKTVLAAFRPGDYLVVDGTYNGAQITATAVRDDSLRIRFAILTGSLVATPAATTPAQPLDLLLQVGKRTVLVEVSAATRLFNRNYAPIALSDLRNGDAVRVAGYYSGVQLNATVLWDLALPATPLQLKGQLAAAPAANILCVANTVVSGSYRRAGTPVTTPCAANQLTVYLTAGTMIVRATGGTLFANSLRFGDMLQITAALRGGQIVASLIVDSSL